MIAVGMPVATTGEIAGRRIVTTHGLVVGLATRSRGLGGNIMAGLGSIGNGDALDEYRDDLAATRREAVARMEAEARYLGANAIVGVRFTAAEVGHDMAEIVAYSTAAVIAQES